MEPLRFVHAADLHLDSPFRGIGDASAALKEQLQAATLGALQTEQLAERSERAWSRVARASAAGIAQERDSARLGDGALAT